MLKIIAALGLMAATCAFSEDLQCKTVLDAAITVYGAPSQTVPLDPTTSVAFRFEDDKKILVFATSDVFEMLGIDFKIYSEFAKCLTNEREHGILLMTSKTASGRATPGRWL